MPITFYGKLYYKIRRLAGKLDPKGTALAHRRGPFDASLASRKIFKALPILAVLIGFFLSAAHIWIRLLPSMRDPIFRNQSGYPFSSGETLWFLLGVVINGWTSVLLCGMANARLGFGNSIFFHLRHYVDMADRIAFKEILVKSGVFIFLFAYALFLALIWPKFAFAGWFLRLLIGVGLLVTLFWRVAQSKSQAWTI